MNFRRPFKNSNKPLIIILLLLVIGGTSFGISMYKLNKMANASVETVTIPVASRSLPQYRVLSQADLVWKEVPKGTEPSYIAKKMEDVIGKVVVEPVAKGSAVPINGIRDKSILAYFQEVSIILDSARNGGAKRGDIVDVYFNPPDNQNNPTARGERRAANARVIEICDSSGNPLSEETDENIVQQAGSALKTNTSNMIYRILIKPNEAAGVTAGGLPKNSMSLVKVFSAEANTSTVGGAIEDNAANQGTGGTQDPKSKPAGGTVRQPQTKPVVQNNPVVAPEEKPGNGDNPQVPITG